MKKKTKIRVALLVMIACAMLMCAVSSTMAWLQAQTDPVVNTFTPSHVDVDLTETTGKNYQMVPGHVISKNPKVTVAADSEDCIVFVEIAESTNPKLSDYVTYAIAEGWTKGSSGNGVPENVIFRTVNKTDTIREFAVLANDQVTVKGTVTEEMMDAITGEGKAQPTLTFKAYAIQLKKSNTESFSAGDAWKQIVGD